ncbi:ABC transporter ATP-binding protein [Clostridium gasigenes]|uniref:ABC transporter ATP-binding protein n=1 Tax=Clostridium gasigenes TaxID=94869 RepID=UPI00143826FB|nr:ABC transporter ATP-binding protein [Clostridium gasigenes]NKF08833.1 ABC transporter ATP-binding protein [Clostridium gasigenes]QSW21243.1 ABC transporter ATP-binding protein [Clostridium gasigenes]
MIKYLKKYKFLFFITLLFSMISACSFSLLPIFIQKIVDSAINSDFNSFKKFIIYTCCYMLLVGILYYIFDLLNKKLNKYIFISLKNDIFKQIINQNYIDFTSRNTADYISLLTNDIKLLEENYLIPIIICFQNLIMFLATLVVLIYYSPLITISLLITMLLMFIVPSLLGKSLRKRQDNLSKEFSSFTNNIKDILSGYEVISSFNIQNVILQSFKKNNIRLGDIKYSSDKLIVLNSTLSQILAYLTQLIGIFLCAYLVLKGDLTAGTLIAIFQLGTSLVSPIMGMLNSIPKISSMHPILNKIQNISEYKEYNKDTSDLKFESHILIKNLSFSYDKNQILNNISLTIHKNKKYALIGESGCGKTTLIKLLLGYYTDYTGDIYFDDKRLSEYSNASINSTLSLIHQNVYMFNKSIFDNICLYNNFNTSQFKEVLKLSGVDKFIVNDDFLYKSVGENGINLSGGQKQRIAIARALIRKTPILILDEGTSAIDMQTAYNIETQLLEMDNLTLLTITHNLSYELLSKYDEIIFMQKNHQIISGKLNDLLENNSEFKNFYTLQTN